MLDSLIFCPNRVFPVFFSIVYTYRTTRDIWIRIEFPLRFKNLPPKIYNKTLIQNSVGSVFEGRVGEGRNELSTLLKALS